MKKTRPSSRLKHVKTLLTFTLPLFLLGGYQIYLKQNGGYAEWKTPTLSLDKDSLHLPPEEIIQESNPSSDELRVLLSQQFSFLGRGGQSFAFIGKDGETVLKIFKNYRYKTYEILQSLPFPRVLQQLILTGMEVRDFKKTRFYRGCVLAAYEIPEVTQVTYIHIFPTEDLNLKLSLQDRLGIHHQVNADSTQFLLQKKLTVADSYAKQLIQDGDQKGFEEMLLATEQMMLERFKHGIADGDFAFDKNVGFINGKAILLDFGSIIKKDVNDPHENRELILCVREELNRLRRLVSRRYPEASDWLNQFFENNPEHLAFAEYLETAAKEQSL